MTSVEDRPARAVDLKPGRIVRFAHGGPMGVLPAVACGAGCGVTVEPAAPAGYIGAVTGVCCAACCDRAESSDQPPAAEPDAPAAGERPTPPERLCTCTDRRDGWTRVGAVYVHARCGRPGVRDG